jgi:Ran GTPase-activating protein (RanGAP) involved in mRNA processing and transport
VISALQKIFLGHDSIKDEGIKYFADAIKVNSTLKWIYLHYNNIRNAEAQYLYDGIKLNSMLELICLRDVSIGDDLTSQIAEKLKENILRAEMNYRKFICAFNIMKTQF